jgi:small subunit ribosomal protein S6
LPISDFRLPICFCDAWKSNLTRGKAKAQIGNRKSGIKNVFKEAVLDTKRQYEVVFIADPEADDVEVQRLTDTFKQLVTDQGGVINRAETMGRRQLAYEILHKTEGTFVLLEIEGSGGEIAELERRMRVNDRILRYITVRVDEDRRRAEKFKSRRSGKAARKTKSAGAGSTTSPNFAAEESYEAE